MAKGTYTVGEGSAGSSKDASFRSCLCAMLVFIAICLIILLAGIKWTKDSIQDDIKDEESKLLGLMGNRDQTTQTSQKPTLKTEPIRTTRTTYTTAEATRKSTSTTTPHPTVKSTNYSTTSSPEYATELIWGRVPVLHSTVKPSTETTEQTATKTSSTRRVEIEGRTTTARTISTPEQNHSYKDFDWKSSSTEAVESASTTGDDLTTSISFVDEFNATKSTATSTSPLIIIDRDKNKLAKLVNTLPETTTESSTSVEPNLTVTDENETQTEENREVIVTTVAPMRYNESNHTNEKSTTTEGTSDYKMIEFVGETNYVDLDDYTTNTMAPRVSELNTTKQPSTTTSSPLIIIDRDKNKVAKPVATSTESTTKAPTTVALKTTTTYEGQRLVEDLDYSEEVTDETEEKNQIIRKREHVSGGTSTTGASPLFGKSEPVCLTAGCKSAASRILSLMDHSADPCDDFYKFACGGMQADNADSDTWARLSEQLYLINSSSPSYLQKFKTFYDSCVSHEYQFDYSDRISKVLALVKEVGTLYGNEPPQDAIDMTDLFAKLIARQALPVMDIDIDVDKQTSTFILKLTLPKTTSMLKESGRWSALTEPQKRCLDEQRHELQQPNLHLTKIYESYLACQKNHAIYLNSIQTVVRALGFYSHLNSFNVTQLVQNVRTTIEWDILEYLNELPPPSEVRKTFLLKDYTIQKISDLQVNYPYLEWARLFKLVTGKPLSNNTLVQVYFPNYFKSLFHGLQRHHKWTINNALLAMYAHNLYENLVIPQAKHTREDYCLKLSSKIFQDISSNLYMKTWSEIQITESQKLLKGVFQMLKQKLGSALQTVDWLDDESRIRILAKLQKMDLTFNKMEDSYNSDKYLDTKYNGVRLESLDFQNNALKMLQIYKNMRYNLQGKQFAINYLWSYFVAAYDSSPTSFYPKTLIMAPLGMAKQGVKGFPGYITMARIGLSLARELGHHFDPVGIEYGMTLSPASKVSYDALQTVMKNDMLLNISRSVGRQKAEFAASPALSLNERIADNTGLRLVSESMNDWGEDLLLPWASSSFSREKLFFIVVAQEYCQRIEMPEYMQQLFETEKLPAPLRVENIMTNSDHFSDAFNCPEGSTMNNNPLKRQFPYLPKEEEYNYYNNEN